jgi:hypothetical protein
VLLEDASPLYLALVVLTGALGMIVGLTLGHLLRHHWSSKRGKKVHH